MIELGAHLEHGFNGRFVGGTMPVLWEQFEDLDGYRRWTGLTDNYIRCGTETPASIDLTNKVADTRLISTVPGGVLGEIDGLTIGQMIEPESRRPTEFANLPIKDQ